MLYLTNSMLTTLITISLILIFPAEAFAWGAGIHIQLGIKVLENLPLINPAIAAIIGAHPNDFLYGCIAADITIGKKYTNYLLNCHRWRMGLAVLDRAQLTSQKACAYGYLAHLAADAIAHNVYVPYKIMRSFATVTMKHAYWEMRFERFVTQQTWRRANEVASSRYQDNDALLRTVIATTLFSFGTNKRIFNSILLVSRLEKWQRVLKTLSDTSRYVLQEDDRLEYLCLAEAAIFDLLSRPSESDYLRADPTGERALVTAEAMRRNLRLLYRSGKIDKTTALAQVDDTKQRLKDALFDPEQLSPLYSTQ
jgi:hypothetical protein